MPNTPLDRGPQTSPREDETTRLHQGFDPSPLPEPFRLTVVQGPDQGKTFVLDGSQPSRVFLGQGPTCDIPLTDRTVSRRHVALDVEGGEVRVSDLGSKNGTRVDDVRVVEAFIRGGELLRVGTTVCRLERLSPAARVALPPAVSWGRTIGASTEMRRLYPLCERLAQADVSVVIEGETGTGKELLAECLHEQGPRAAGPFVVLDCSGVPTAALESELVGLAGDDGYPGVMEQARGGTLLINEIADMDPALQVRLLRILERKEVRRAGSVQPIATDVRLLVSTRRDLDREVAAGRFRDELMQRIGVARIELPPLRRRKGDIPVLVRHFCSELGGTDQALKDLLRLSWDDNSWPGNVRELRSSVARHLALGDLASELAKPESLRDDLPRNLEELVEQTLTLPLGEARQHIVLEFERRYVRSMLERHSGNVTHAAESAGVARRYFQILKARIEKQRRQ